MIGLSFRWPAPMICCACPMYWDTERFARSLQLASLPTMSPLHQHRSTVSFVVRTHAPAQPQDFPIDAHDDPSSAYLITAEYCGLSKSSLHNYAKQGRLRAKKVGLYWVTTQAAVDEYLHSRHLENIPKKYRNQA